MGNCHTFSEQDVKIWETETCDTEIGWDGVECMDYESALERCAGFKYDTCYAITNTTEGRRCREALEAQFDHWAGEYGDDARSFRDLFATNQDCIVLIVVLSVVGFLVCVAGGFAYLFWRRTRALERLAAVGATPGQAAPTLSARAVGNAGVVAALPDWLRRDMSHNFVSRSDVGIVGIYFLVVMMIAVGHARMDATTPSTPLGRTILRGHRALDDRDASIDVLLPSPRPPIPAGRGRPGRIRRSGVGANGFGCRRSGK